MRQHQRTTRRRRHPLFVFYSPTALSLRLTVMEGDRQSGVGGRTKGLRSYWVCRYLGTSSNTLFSHHYCLPHYYHSAKPMRVEQPARGHCASSLPCCCRHRRRCCMFAKRRGDGNYCAPCSSSSVHSRRLSLCGQCTHAACL